MEEAITQWLLEISHYPMYLYLGVIILLFASSFGLPFPEEIVLLTSGMIANLSYIESLETGTEPMVPAALLATVCFFAVFMSDLLVFALGKGIGVKLLRRKPISNFITADTLLKIEGLTKKYGAYASGIFRFTPGLRFPGHFMCGATGLSYTKFILVDGLAVLVSVPSQVLLMAYYGQEILAYIKQFKIVVGVLILVFIIFYFSRKYLLKTRMS